MDQRLTGTELTQCDLRPNPLPLGSLNSPNTAFARHNSHFFYFTCSGLGWEHSHSSPMPFDCPPIGMCLPVPGRVDPNLDPKLVS